jgi:hypothetical protein
MGFMPEWIKVCLWVGIVGAMIPLKSWNDGPHWMFHHLLDVGTASLSAALLARDNKS